MNIVHNNCINIDRKKKVKKNKTKTDRYNNTSLDWAQIGLDHDTAFKGQTTNL